MKTKSDERMVLWISIAFICLLFFFLSRSTWSIKVDAAEFENLQASWLVSQGYLPYSQFFDHHTPLFFYFLSPFFSILGPIQTDPKTAIQSISLVRCGMIFLTFLIAGCVYGITRLWRGKQIAWMSFLLYLSIDMVARKAIEIRPNLPATLLLMVSIFLLVLAEKIDKNKLLVKFLSGLLYSLAVLMAEETLLFGLWILLILIADIIWSKTEEKPARLRASLLIFAGFGVGIAAFLLYLIAHHMFALFFQLLLQPDTYRASPLKKIIQLVLENPLHFLFVGTSLFTLWRSIRVWRQDRITRIVVFFAMGMIVSLLITMEPHGQYFFFALPMYAVVAGDGAIKCYAWISDWLSRRTHKQRLVSMSFLVAGLLTALFWQFFLAGFPKNYFAVLLVIIGVLSLLLGLFSAIQGNHIAFQWVIIPLIVIGIIRTQERVIHNELTVQPSIQVIRHVIKNSDPTDRVLDGRSGTGLYRPIAWYYWVQHTQIGEEISMNEVNKLVNSLGKNDLSPKFIYLDRFLHRYPLLVEAVESKYQPVGISVLWQKEN